MNLIAFHETTRLRPGQRCSPAHLLLAFWQVDHYRGRGDVVITIDALTDLPSDGDNYHYRCKAYQHYGEGYLDT